MCVTNKTVLVLSSTTHLLHLAFVEDCQVLQSSIFYWKLTQSNLNSLLCLKQWADVILQHFMKQRHCIFMDVPCIYNSCLSNSLLKVELALKYSQNVSVRYFTNMGCCVYITSLNFVCWELGLTIGMPCAIIN